MGSRLNLLDPPDPPLPSPVLSIIRNARAPLRASAAIRPARRRALTVPALARARRVYGSGGLTQAAVRDRDPPAQRHGRAAHGPGAEQSDAGPAHPVLADARPGSLVAPRHRPRRDRHAERGGAPDREGGEDALRPRP